MTSSQASAVRRNVTKLQKAIVEGLEDVKAQDIQMFDTEHLTSLFERVIVASGTSNRQTKALAASVREAVRAAGFDKPRVEGEDNGEWIIVDCGAAVVHIMQPSIRQYYHLEELWGEKSVKTRAAKAAKPTAARAPKSAPAQPEDRSPPRKRSAKSSSLAAATAPTAPTIAPAGKTPADEPAARRSTRARAVAAAPTRKVAAPGPAAKTPRKTVGKTVGKTTRKAGTGKA